MKILIQEQQLLHNTSEHCIMKKIAILGSCVTKDAFKYNDGSLDVQHAYYPRASVISLMSSPVDIDKSILIAENAWLNWIILNDFNKTTLHQLSAHNPSIICIDLIEERFDVFKIQDSYITYSDELSKYHPNARDLAAGARIPFHSEERRQLLSEKLSLLCAKLNSFFKNSTIVIHKALYSNYYLDGGNILKFSPEQCHKNGVINDVLSFGYDYLSSHIDNVRVIDTPPQIQIANSKHIWGLSPFHYIDEYYKHFMSELISISHE
ncbi:DUF6270 domain-containing protein [Aeromonas piscicola]|uniref:DUF6270 domain-containing protein n=1 Tax=Aeromonas piscicola TaxID=600645 RepID=UPI0021F8ECD2|nr:DUF6270 domain-containing protein [Aeromonas piscicola]MCW0503723.1 DUF6270 domain-containing protein [Aeromonas piscicola]